MTLLAHVDLVNMGQQSYTIGRVRHGIIANMCSDRAKHGVYNLHI